MVNKNFRTLNHHYKDGNSTYQDKAQNQTISSSNQQQLTAIRRQKKPKTAERDSNKEIRIKNSPHNEWSLHNHLPREIRNIVPETPTQNVPALPQNSSPLVRQHRSNSCNKNHSHKNNLKTPN
jgi:hypothetical protein